METKDALLKRQSVRAFLDKPIESEQLQKLLHDARYAPSSVNSQPWRVAIVQGASLQKLSDRLIAAAATPAGAEVHYYPDRWFEPYLSRRRGCGLALYSALEISRRDVEKQRAARLNNFRFFNAPVGLVLLTHKELNDGSLVDMGIFYQSLMLLATDAGLGSCALGSIAEYPDAIREALELEDCWKVVGGLALGWPDWDAPINNFRTDRAEEKELFTWYN
jgi:nitroreductase